MCVYFWSWSREKHRKKPLAEKWTSSGLLLRCLNSNTMPTSSYLFRFRFRTSFAKQQRIERAFHRSSHCVSIATWSYRWYTHCLSPFISLGSSSIALQFGRMREWNWWIHSTHWSNRCFGLFFKKIDSRSQLRVKRNVRSSEVLQDIWISSNREVPLF